MKKTLWNILLVGIYVFVCLFVFHTISHAQGSPVGSTTGVLVITHGSPESTWNRYVRWAVDDLKMPFPVELGYLEATSPDINDAVNALVSKGAKRIVAVPLFISSFSGHLEEIKYVLRLRETKPSDEDLKRIDATIPIGLTRAVDDHPFVVKIMADRILEAKRQLDLMGLGGSMPDMGLIFVAHGDEGFKQEWDSVLTGISAKTTAHLKKQTGLSFKGVDHYYLYQIKDMITYCKSNPCPGDGNQYTFVVSPFFLSPGSITQQTIPDLLGQIRGLIEGIRFVYIKDPLLPSPYVSRVVEARVAEALTPSIRIYDSGQIKEINPIENSIEDNEKFCPARLLAHKAFYIALTMMGPEDYIPQRSDISVATKLPQKDIKEIFERMAAGVNQLGSDEINMTAQDFYFEITDKRLNKKVILNVKEDIFPKDFFALRTKMLTKTASEDEKKQFQGMRERLIEKILWSTSKEEMLQIFNY